MTQDFFAHLERQLVDAATDRRRRLRRARARRAATASTILVAVLAVGAGLAAALSATGDGTRSAPAGSTPGVVTATVPAGAAAPPRPGAYTVAVLNGTALPGLARGVANRLQNGHFKIGNVTNAPRQDHRQTEVYFARGHMLEANQVAAAIGFQGKFTLRPMTAAQRVPAGAQADVVVVVGADQNTSPTP